MKQAGVAMKSRNLEVGLGRTNKPITKEKQYFMKTFENPFDR